MTCHCFDPIEEFVACVIATDRRLAFSQLGSRNSRVFDQDVLAEPTQWRCEYRPRPSNRTNADLNDMEPVTEWDIVVVEAANTDFVVRGKALPAPGIQTSGTISMPRHLRTRGRPSK